MVELYFYFEGCLRLIKKKKPDTLFNSKMILRTFFIAYFFFYRDKRGIFIKFEKKIRRFEARHSGLVKLNLKMAITYLIS